MSAMLCNNPNHFHGFGRPNPGACDAGLMNAVISDAKARLAEARIHENTTNNTEGN